MNDPVEQLTTGQRDCLRLVYRHLTSKDIARALDISPHTVDMRLRTALKTLSVATRFEAARMLVEHEAGDPLYQPLIYQASEVAAAAAAVKLVVPAPTEADGSASPLSPERSEPVVEPPAGGPPRLAGGSTKYDGPQPGGLRHDGEARFDTPLAQSLPWGDRNRLTPGARLAWIAMIAIGSALAFGSILGALQALKALI